MWNRESSLPSGMMPTILDRAIGLPQQPRSAEPCSAKALPANHDGSTDLVGAASAAKLAMLE
ncbi:hypothetical protein AXG53_04385 [Stenotrophomonas sp. KCTC 12332]|nr:hypothetical protein AXG53_04385 [Stenotrophomonas sp. KCTC 12332]